VARCALSAAQWSAVEPALLDVVVGGGHVQDGVAVFVACFAEWGCAEAVEEGVDVV